MDSPKTLGFRELIQRLERILRPGDDLSTGELLELLGEGSIPLTNWAKAGRFKDWAYQGESETQIIYGKERTFKRWRWRRGIDILAPKTCPTCDQPLP